MPIISVVVPTFRRPAYVREAVRSVLAQDVHDIEVIVVDDAGGATLDLPGDPRVRVLVQPSNGGSSAARNRGAAAAVSDHVTFLDDDDWVTADRYSSVLDQLDDHHTVVCWTRWHDETAPSAGRRLDGLVGSEVVAGPTPHVGATVVPRRLLQRFDESMRTGEDVEWWVRQAQVTPLRTVPVHGHVMRRHEGVRHGKDDAARAAAHAQVLARHGRSMSRRARAFRWARVGRLLLSSGDRSGARRALVRSLLAFPTLPVAVDLLGLRGLVAMVRARRGARPSRRRRA